MFNNDRSIALTSLEKRFGIKPNHFDLIFSPHMQNTGCRGEALGPNIIKNGNFTDFTLDNDSNTKGHWILSPDRPSVLGDNFRLFTNTAGGNGASVTNATLTGSNEFTILTRFMVITGGVQGNLFLSETYLTDGFRFGFTSGSDYLRPELWTTQSGGSINLTDKNVSFKEWHNFAVSMKDNGTDHTVTRFLDGVVDYDTGTYIPSNSDTFYIGGRSGLNNDHYVAFTYFYDRALSVAEIEQVYAGNAPASGLQLKYLFNNEETWLNDLSGNGYDLTQNNVRIVKGNIGSLFQDWSGDVGAYSDQLCTNRFFETNTTGWTGTRSNLSVVPGGVTGNALLVSRSDVSPSTTNCRAQYTVSPTPSVGDRFKIKMSFKKGTAASADLVVYWSGIVVTETFANNITNAEWTEYEYETVVPTGATMMSVWCQINTTADTGEGQTGYFDNISVEKLSSGNHLVGSVDLDLNSQVIRNKQINLNPSFETDTSDWIADGDYTMTRITTDPVRGACLHVVCPVNGDLSTQRVRILTAGIENAYTHRVSFLAKSISGEKTISVGHTSQANVYNAELTSEWTHHTFTMSRPGGTALSGPIFYLLDGTGEFLLDEVYYTVEDDLSPVLKGAGGLILDGVNDYLSIPAADATDFDFGTGNFTIEAWVRTISTATQVLVKKKDSTDNSTLGWCIYFNAAANQVGFKVSNGSTDKTAIHNTDIGDGEWHFISAVRSGDTLQINVDNGTPVTVTGVSAFDFNNTSDDLIVGKNNSSGYWDGEIAEMRISDTARSGELMLNSYDWTDTNTDGIPDSWATNFGTGSIVTGNGFTGNAFKIANSSGQSYTGTSLANGFMTIGQRYRVSFKYRSDDTAFYIANAGVAGIATVGPNTGDAASFTKDFRARSTKMDFNCADGKYFEIDEVSVVGLPDYGLAKHWDSSTVSLSSAKVGFLNDNFKQRIIAGSDDDSSDGFAIQELVNQETGALYKLTVRINAKLVGNERVDVKIGAANGSAPDLWLQLLSADADTEYTGYFVGNASYTYLWLAFNNYDDIDNYVTFEYVKINKVILKPVPPIALDYSKGLKGIPVAWYQKRQAGPNFPSGLEQDDADYTIEANDYSATIYNDTDMTTTSGKCANSIHFPVSNPGNALRIRFKDAADGFYSPLNRMVIRFYDATPAEIDDGSFVLPSGMGWSGTYNLIYNGWWTDLGDGLRVANSTTDYDFVVTALPTNCAYVSISIGTDTVEPSIYKITDFRVEEIPGTFGVMKGDLHFTGVTEPNKFLMDGSNDYIIFDDIKVYNHSFILNTWYRNDTPDTTQRLIGNEGYLTNQGYHIRLSGANLIYAGVSDGTNYINLLSSGSVSSTEWQLLSLVWDALSKTLYLYKNGVLVNSETNTNVTGSLDHATSKFQISGYNGTSQPCGGSFGDTTLTVFDGTAGKSAILPSDYVNFIRRLYNATEEFHR